MRRQKKLNFVLVHFAKSVNLHQLREWQLESYENSIRLRSAAQWVIFQGSQSHTHMWLGLGAECCYFRDLHLCNCHRSNRFSFDSTAPRWELLWSRLSSAGGVRLAGNSVVHNFSFYFSCCRLHWHLIPRSISFHFRSCAFIDAKVQTVHLSSHSRANCMYLRRPYTVFGVRSCKKLQSIVFLVRFCARLCIVMI